MTARSLFVLLACLFPFNLLLADPPVATEAHAPWADITGDGVPEQIRLRPVVRDGVNGFDFGVWNPVGDHYLGDIAKMPETPGMLGYVFSFGPDLDGDGLPELWIADPAAREFVNGRGCVYVYSWQDPLPLMKLQGPGTDTLGTDMRIQTPDNGTTWTVHVASHFQDIFGHVYERWSTFNTLGQRTSTDLPSTATLVLKSGDVDKNLSTDQTDVAAVYQKAADLMADLGITGQKHDEDLDGDDFVDAADILSVINSLGVPEPQAASLTETSIYSVAPQRALGGGCWRCNYPCCYAGTCTCTTIFPPGLNLNARWYATHPGWWTPTSLPPGTILPPGVYPDRRQNRDPYTAHEGCDGFRILPGDIESGGILLPATFTGRSDSVTAIIEDSTIAQFAADQSGRAMPRIPGGEIELRSSLNTSALIVANGHIRIYGLIPGETRMRVEIRSGGNPPVVYTQPIKVGGRIEARLKTVRRWSPQNGAETSSWWNAHDTDYAAKAASQATSPPPPFVGTTTTIVPPQDSPVWSRSNRLGTKPGLRGSNSDGDGSDQVVIFDACDDPVSRPKAFFTKRLFLGSDSDGDGISDPTETMESQYVNHQRIEDLITAKKGPFAGTAFNTPAKRSQAHPGSEIMVVVVGHTADRLFADWRNSVPSPRNYFFPKVFGDIITTTDQLPGGQFDFERWAGRDAGTAKFTPAYHKFRGVMTQFGRDFAPAEHPTRVGGYQQQSITGATFPVPILNAAVYESLERNFNRHEVLGTAQLYDPNPQGEYISQQLAFSPLRIFGAAQYEQPGFIPSLDDARRWVLQSGTSQLATQYWQSAGLPAVQVYLPMTDEEFREMMEEIGDGGESVIRGSIFWAEIGLGFVPVGDVVGILFHGGMMIVGDTEDHRLDLLMGVVGLGADLGYLGAAAGMVTNGAVAAVRIAIRYISKLDNGATLRIILRQSDSMLSSLKRFVLYASKHRPDWIYSVDLTNPIAVAAGVKRYATELGEILINSFSRMAKSAAAQQLVNAVDATGLPWLVRSYEEAVNAVLKGPMQHMAGRVLTEQASEGWCVLAMMRGVPELEQVTVKLRGALDLGGTPAAKALGDRATIQFGENLKRLVDAPGAEAQHLVRAVDAAKVINHGVDLGRFDAALRAAAIGEGKPFATAEEFIAAIRFPGNHLDPLQRAAINNFRNLITVPNRVAKVMPLRQGNPFLTNPDGGSFADDMLSQNQHNLGGSICDPADLVGSNSMDEINQTLRLDYQASAFVSGGPYAVIETSTPALRQNASIPRGHGYETGAAGEYNISTQPFPRTGSAYTAASNGKLVPEWSARSTGLAGGVDELGSPVTTMKFRHGDGSPYMHTREVNGQAVTASDWKLIEPAPGVFQWVPL